jgi:hypothetical protein
VTVQPYSREFFAPRPSPATIFFRTFVLWQLVRFVWINFKMIGMIGKSHSHRLPSPPSGTGPRPRRRAPAVTPSPNGGALLQGLDAARAG